MLTAQAQGLRAMGGFLDRRMGAWVQIVHGLHGAHRIGCLGCMVHGTHGVHAI